jgi:hypothetical protein
VKHHTIMACQRNATASHTPLLVLFKDATRDLIRPDTLITLDGPPFGEKVNVKWADKRGSIFVQDLRFRATRELES